MKSRRTTLTLVTSAYVPWLAALKDRVRSAQLQAAVRINHELLRLYWEIGVALVDAQAREGWGQAVIPRLARDLRAEFPAMQGFSERNLGYMVRFAREYGSPSILQQAAAKLPGAGKEPPPAAQISGDFTSTISPQPAAKSSSPDPTSPNRR